MKSRYSEKLYRKVKKIRRGKVSTYKEVALSAGFDNPRLAGIILSRNPYIGYVPCHRVVKSDGTVGGYSGAGGKEGKISLLKSEGIKFEGDTIKNFKRRLVCRDDLKDE